MGERRDTPSLMRVLAITVSGSSPSLLSTGATELDKTLAPMETKKERKIHTATDARNDVATLRKAMEKRMESPSQKEM